METNKALLAVSFGTSYEKARKANIEAIEADLAGAFPEHRLYRAWTSRMILKVLKERDHLYIPNVDEAMEQMIKDGIRELIVQPTHILNGIENHIMEEQVLSYKEHFDSISFGLPLLSSPSDSEKVIRIIAEAFPQLDKKTVLVMMGHGTSHEVNTVYAELDREFKKAGHPNIFLGTVEASPTVQDLVKEVCSYGPQKVLMTPFMIVAGDHAHNDMAGEDEDSWVSQFRAHGYEVEPVLKGLGEYPGIRALYVQHAKESHNCLK